MKKYSNNLGAHVIESVGIMILVVTTIIAGAHFLKKGPRGPSFNIEDRRLREEIKKDRAEAQLIIVGRIAKKSARIQTGISGDSVPMSLAFAYLDFTIESIEKGRYPYKEISAYFGWASSLQPPETLPWGAKTDYKVGDKVRVFLSYGVPSGLGTGPDKPCYFTRLAYLSLDPL